MISSETKFLAKPFSHIYIEEAALNYEITKEICLKYPNASIIKIKHYKDVFNRSKQNFLLQKYSKALILAVNNGEKIYKGARMCQSFGNDNFYYTSNIMNCVYDCEYCYLQGMYPSGNMVIYVNYQDYFNVIEEKLKTQKMYICISYDTDLLALEGLTGLVSKWIAFTNSHDKLLIEIRTKSAYDISRFEVSDRVIFAWTLSPNIIIENYEHMTPALEARIKAINQGIKKGHSVRLCLDPMIYINNYQNYYSEFYELVFNSIDTTKILDVSLGLFRISSSYIKAMRSKRKTSITAYPYTVTEGVCSYEQKKSDEMLNFARLEISKYYPLEKIFCI